MEYIVKNRIDTTSFIHNMIMNKKRVVVSRYCDGEVNILRKVKGIGLHVGNENSIFVEPLLRQAIINPNHFMCIPELKKHNIENQDRWVKVQKELADLGGRNVYGAGNWHLWDFQNNNDVLSNIFSGSVLVISGHAPLVKKAFEQNNVSVDCYETSLKEASLNYNKYYNDLSQLVKDRIYDNILFCCGPIGKVLMVDLIPECCSNIVDIGCLINAIIDGVLHKDKRVVKTWNMNWADKVDIYKCSEILFNKILEKNKRT